MNNRKDPMKHFRGLQPIREQRVWATIGAFDGVHVGHQKLITSMVNEARENQASAVVITFFPHPAVVLRNLPMPFYLTSPEEKSFIFDRLSVDYTVTLEFNLELAGKTPKEFMEMIINQMPLKKLWLGTGFVLGKNRSGTIPVLKELGRELGYDVKEFSHLKSGGEKISSSEIRKLIQDANIYAANKELGRPYSLEGMVIHGDSRGKSIGFPTANISVWDGKILPPAGVYATRLYLEGKLYDSVTNVGYRPTFVENQIRPTVETYVMDFDKEIYGHKVKLLFIENIRPEIRFENINSLTKQIHQDVQNAEEILKNAPQTNGLFT